MAYHCCNLTYSMKYHLLSLIALLPFLNFGQALTENFEGDTFPPTGWTIRQTNEYQTWIKYPTTLLGGDFAAIVDRDSNAEPQEEWLISPAVDLTGYDSAYLRFSVAMSYYYGVSPYDKYGISVKLSVDGGTTWEEMWTENELGVFSELAPKHVTLNISAGINLTNVKVAFVYTGTDGSRLVLDDISITELEQTVFPEPYCVVEGLTTVEAISLVQFANINNATDPDDETIVHEDFTALVADVNRGENYPTILEGHTWGDYRYYFTIFIDWNQNGSFLDDGEWHEAGFIDNSNGADGIQALSSITVPSDAVLGLTRMRVFKNYEDPTPSPCSPQRPFGGYGQVEEYSVRVAPHLATSSFGDLQFSFYPNPVKNELHFAAAKTISAIKVYNVLGQEVFSNEIQAKQGKADLSALPAGNYTAKIYSENSNKTIKIVKQ